MRAFRRHVLPIVLIAIGVPLLAGPTHASRATLSPASVVRALREVLDTPENQVDFAKAKLAIDRIVDPSLDTQATLARIDAMAAQLRSMLPIAASTEQRASALRTFLYDAGPWNQGQVFSFNLEHPTGTFIPDKLLANYVRTHKGNCVSMPALHLALAQKLGLEATLATSPQHLFVKLRDDRGVWHNIETTSGGFTRRDVLYQEDSQMTAEALAKGIYMRPLSKREAVLAMASVVMEHFSEQQRADLLHAVADLTLQRDPKNVTAMLHKAQAHLIEIRQRYVRRYPTPQDIPLEKRQDFLRLRAERERWHRNAEQLGWRAPSAESESRYLSIVQAAALAAKR